MHKNLPTVISITFFGNLLESMFQIRLWPFDDALYLVSMNNSLLQIKFNPNSTISFSYLCAHELVDIERINKCWYSSFH